VRHLVVHSSSTLDTNVMFCERHDAICATHAQPSIKANVTNTAGMLVRKGKLLPDGSCYTRWSYSTPVKQRHPGPYALIYPLIALGVTE
jgi:hypothetical protein